MVTITATGFDDEYTGFAATGGGLLFVPPAYAALLSDRYNRVGAYAFLLVTDEYPPFRLGA